MIEPQPSSRIKEAVLRARDASVRTWQRTYALVRRHPWKSALALPALLVLYVGALYPFTPSIGDIKKAKLEQPTVVLTADGKELAVFKRANRDWIKLTDVSPHVVDALISTEDHRFYKHHGFDAARTAKAAFNTVGGDRQGGSTLTQQLARNLYPEDVGRAPTITRKVKELITALKIEAIYSKQEILETYLNTVPFLYNAYGIEAAAQTYFDKPASKLDVSQAATLVGMLKGTSYYNPVLNPDRAIQRRNTVLAQMVKHGKLPPGQFESLAKKPISLDFERQPEFGGMAPHLAQNIKRWLIDWADRNDHNIYADGLVVRTSIDSRMQLAANEAAKRQGDRIQAVADVEWGRAGGGFGSDPDAYVAQQSKVQAFSHFWASQKNLLNEFIRESGEYRALRDSGVADDEALAKLQGDEEFIRNLKRSKTRVEAGFMAVNPINGHVKAWVGSRDYEKDKFDHVAQARRQPGSTFKPFVYAAAFEAGARATDSYIDQPVEIRVDKNQVWRPTDMHGSTNAPMTLREGLVKSKNTITAQVMQQVGPSRVAQVARAMGVRQSPLHAVPSLALGTSPVTLREMVTSYATIANNGSFIEPIVVLRVEDRSGRVLEEFSPELAQHAVSTETAQTLLDVMRGVIDEGTAVGMRPRWGIPREADLAGKTGTTQNNTDGWFVVMHPQLVAGAWMGFNDNRVTMRSEYWGQGGHNALFIVGDFLKQSFEGKVLDVTAKFSVPKDSSKGTGSVWDPLVGRVNDWWNSMFSGGTNEQAALPQPAPMPPPLPKAEPMPPVEIMAEPMRLPESGGALGSSPRPQPPLVVGAPQPRTPDAVIAAPAMPSAAPPAHSYTPEPARPLAGGRLRMPGTVEVAPAPTPTTPQILSPSQGTSPSAIVIAPSAPVIAPQAPRESVTVSRPVERSAPEPVISAPPSVSQATGSARSGGESGTASSSGTSAGSGPSLKSSAESSSSSTSSMGSSSGTSSGTSSATSGTSSSSSTSSMGGSGVSASTGSATGGTSSSGVSSTD